MNKLLTRLWIWLKYGKPTTSFVLLHMALDSTEKIQQLGDDKDLAEWCKNYLIPSLDEVRDWAEKVIRDHE